MDKAALELLQHTAVLANAKLLETHTPSIVLPEKTNVTSLEKYQAQRSRFRGDFTTNSLKDFADYVISRQGPAARGFVQADDPNRLTCKVLFNLGDEAAPGHADDTGTLSLTPTVGYAAVRKAANQQFTQRELSDWIEDWHSLLLITDTNGDTLDAQKAVAAVRNIKIKASSEAESKIGNMGAQRSAMEEIEARSADTLPALLTFSCAPYEGLAIQQFRLSVRVITSGDAPKLSLRWMQKEAQEEEIAQEFKAKLKTEIGGATKLTIGHFDPR